MHPSPARCQAYLVGDVTTLSRLLPRRRTTVYSAVSATFYVLHFNHLEKLDRNNQFYQIISIFLQSNAAENSPFMDVLASAKIVHASRLEKTLTCLELDL